MKYGWSIQLNDNLLSKFADFCQPRGTIFSNNYLKRRLKYFLRQFKFLSYKYKFDIFSTKRFDIKA